MIPTVVSALAASASPIVVLVEDPELLTPSQRRRLERRLGEVAVAPLSDLWQDGRLPPPPPDVSGPCGASLAAVHALGFIDHPEQRAPFLRALRDVSTCASAHGLTGDPFWWSWDGETPIDPWACRAASLIAAEPALVDTLPEELREIPCSPPRPLPLIAVGWPAGAPPPVVDGLGVEVTDGEFGVAVCGADLSWSSGGGPGSSQRIRFEDGGRQFPLDAARRWGRAVLDALEGPALAGAHLEHAAVYAALVGRFAVADTAGGLRIWTWEGDRFEPVAGRHRAHRPQPGLDRRP